MLFVLLTAIGVIVVIVPALILFIVLLYQRFISRFYKLGNCISGPPTIPILGNAQYFLNLPIEKNYKVLFDFSIEYGDFYRIWLGDELNVIIINPIDLKMIMSKMEFINKSDAYHTMQKWLREGLLLSKGIKWHKRRRIITPAFHFKILESFVRIFHHQSRILIEKHLAKCAEMKAPFQLNDFINGYTLDVISETAMGVSVNAQMNAESDYVKAVKTISTVLHKRMFDIFYRFDFIYQFTKLAKEEKQALHTLHSFTEKIIIQRREEILNRQKEGQTTTDDSDVGVKKKMAFLDILLQSEIDGKPLSNLDIREEVDTFMFEGHDTTSSAITFFFFNIALHPECQRKCYEEIEAIFGDDRNKSLTYDDLNKLTYTELCIKETLRMFPSVPLLGRKVTKECEINGRVIPAGTNIGISPLHIGRSEKFFPKPNDFIPERFDVATSPEKVNPYAYIPFSAGPRNCIGQKFAMLEMKSVIAYVLSSFELKYAGNPEEELVLVAELILRTKDPIMFFIQKRI